MRNSHSKTSGDGPVLRCSTAAWCSSGSSEPLSTPSAGSHLPLATDHSGPSGCLRSGALRTAPGFTRTGASAPKALSARQRKRPASFILLGLGDFEIVDLHRLALRHEAIV